jgi:hypothetical protein
MDVEFSEDDVKEEPYKEMEPDEDKPLNSIVSSGI